jgi:hypothetical protein
VEQGPLPVLRAGGGPVLWAVRLLLALLILEVVAFLVSTLPGVRGALGFETPGFDPLLDGWLQGAGYVTAALLALVRPISSPVDRGIWAWLAAAVAARAVGFVVFLGYVRTQQPPSYPSEADAAWLAMYVLMLAGLVELARRRTPVCPRRSSWTPPSASWPPRRSPWCCCTGRSCP